MSSTHLGRVPMGNRGLGPTVVPAHLDGPDFRERAEAKVIEPAQPLKRPRGRTRASRASAGSETDTAD
jgi:hypothetical protein